MPALQFSPAWPGPALLVPITLDALLVGTPNQTAQTNWAQTGVQYGKLNYQSAGVLPFQAKKPPGVGAHLLWSLPYALRSGKQLTEGANQGDVEFPVVPNRWALLRWFVPPSSSDATKPSATPPALSAGILRSDALHKLGAADSPYPTEDGDILGIGEYVPIDTWDGSVTGTNFLQASGPGDVAWSAAYDNVRNAFAFHDDLTNAVRGFYSYQIIGWYADSKDDPLSHWSAQEDWNSLMSQLGWGVGQDQENALPAGSVFAAQAAWQSWAGAHGLSGATFNAGGINPSVVPPPLDVLMTKWGAYYAANGNAAVPTPQLALPAQTLCHGAVLGVQWKGASYGYSFGGPNGLTGPKVSVGNTPSEAVATWMANTIAQGPLDPGTDDIAYVERALEAFQKGLIFDLGTQPQETVAKLHAARFGGRDGGSHWTVIRPEQETSELAPKDQAGNANATMPLTEPQIDALRALNKAQTAADTAQQAVQAMQWELWALYNKQWKYPSKDKQTLINAAIVALAGPNAPNNKGPVAGLLGAQLANAAASDAAVKTAQQSLQTLLTSTDATKGFIIKKVNNTPFTAPVDPVILISGTSADTKNAPPGTYGSDGFTFTRFTGQTLSAITVTPPTAPTKSVTLSAADVVPNIQFPGAQGSVSSLGMPKEWADMWIESMLVDTSSSAWLAMLFMAKYETLYGAPPPLTAAEATQLIAAQQTALWNNPATVGVTISAIAAAAQFTGVPPNAVAFENGTMQPWSPLYIDWRVQWMPSLVEGLNVTSEWKLNRMGVDYEWTGSQLPTSGITFTGRTSVDPLASQQMARQLEDFVNTDPDLDHLPVSIRQDLIQVKSQIGKYDFVTQSLSGLTQQWLTRLSSPSMQLFSNTPSPDLLKQLKSAQGMQPVMQTPTGGPPPYSPLRAGHFRITRLWVVDAYGQVLEPWAQGSTAVNVLASNSLLTPQDTTGTYVQLPPRFSQPARLNFTMVDANNDALDSTSADDTSPICGWVMSNHLDDSLMVYDSLGNNLGSVIVIDRDMGQTGLRWDAAPGSSQPLGAPPDIANAHLSKFINALLLAGANGSESLRQLLDVIDAASWIPRPANSTQAGRGNATLLVGKPYAVVRAKLDMQLWGDPMLALDQNILTTGKFYPPAPPPKFMDTSFSVRVGDENFRTNSAVGYFVGDDYSVFNAVSAAPQRTSKLRREIVAGGKANVRDFGRSAALTTAGDVYVVPSTPVNLKPSLSTQPVAENDVYLTLLVDPSGRIPVVSGAFPVLYGDLPPGPVATALDQMAISFRTGPLLLDPAAIRMPLPSEMHGNWSWMERETVTRWAAPQAPGKANPIPSMANVPLRLREGWLVLSKS